MTSLSLFLEEAESDRKKTELYVERLIVRMRSFDVRTE